MYNVQLQLSQLPRSRAAWVWVWPYAVCAGI